VLLNKTLRSSTIKLAFIYVIIFSSAIFALLGCIYSSTASYLYKKPDQFLKVERELMNNAYNEAGRNGIIALINRRISDGFFSDWVYLLTRPSHEYVARNLKSWIPAFQGDQRWSNLVSLHEVSDRTEPALRATSRVLPDAYHLLIGRKVEDLHGLLQKIATVLASGAGLFLLLAAAAGISSHGARLRASNRSTRPAERLCAPAWANVYRCAEPATNGTGLPKTSTRCSIASRN
jgi:hypothetical protein